MSRSSKITETTLIPLSLLTVIVGGIYWLTSMYFQTAANARDISEIKADIAADRKDVVKVMQEANQRLSRIEGRLGIEPTK